METSVELPVLSFPDWPVKLRSTGQKIEIYDGLRKRWLVLQPEEWVRQSLIYHLMHQLGFPVSCLAIENGLQLGKLKKRTDIRVYKKGVLRMLVECKAPQIALSQDVFDQAQRYNKVLSAPYILITNGIHHLLANLSANGATFSNQIPAYTEL